MNVYRVIRRPLVTEKSNIGREEQNLVTLAVDPQANKHDIRRAVESLFDVTVVDVHTMRMPRKTKRVGRSSGRKSEWKKAIVRLAEGQTIEFFEGV
jgi:large subunit ribosomal protein L23